MLPNVDIDMPFNDWRPRPYQLGAWGYLENGGKRACLIWHRRAGKDDVALHYTACAALQRVGNYWHMLPEASQARKALWDAMNPHTGRRRIDEVFPREIRAGTRDTDMFIRFVNGSTWQVVGSDNFDSLVGSPPVGLVFSEYAIADPRAWTMLRPILAENGGWAIFPFTPRGKNHGAALRDTARDEPNWLLDVRTVADTGIFDPKALEAERRELHREYGPDVGEAYFRQEYHVSFDAPVRGAYYAGLIEQAEADGRITGVPYDGAAMVDTAWDLGIGDSTAIVFMQAVGRELHCIDAYEASGQPLAHYVEVLRNKGYKYDTHYLPHDAAAREHGTGKTRAELLQAMGVRPTVVDRLPIDDGIQAVRAMLPRIWFDKKRCDRLLDALRNYRAEYDEGLKVLKDRPKHDWSSHLCDAVRYFAVGYKDRQPLPRRRPALSWVA